MQRTKLVFLAAPVAAAIGLESILERGPRQHALHSQCKAAESTSDVTIQPQLPCLVRLEGPGLADCAAFLKLGFPQDKGQDQSAERESQADYEEKQESHHRDQAGNEAEGFFRSNISHILSKSVGWHSVEKMAPIAKEYSKELKRLREILTARGVSLPEDRFKDNNVELMRFAFTMGLTQAEGSAELNSVLEGTADRVEDAITWLQEQNFKPASELKDFNHLLYWNGESESGHPVLVIKIGKASHAYKGEALLDFAEAIISQVQHAVEDKFSDEEGQPEQLVAVVECSGASPFQGPNLLKVIKQVSLTLNRHYPGRLHQFYVVDLPRMLKWPVKAIIALGHPSTRQKVILCRHNDSRVEDLLRTDV